MFNIVHSRFAKGPGRGYWYGYDSLKLPRHRHAVISPDPDPGVLVGFVVCMYVFYAMASTGCCGGEEEALRYVFVSAVRWEGWYQCACLLSVVTVC